HNAALYLVHGDADVLLGKLDVFADAELVDESDAGDGRHGRHLQPVRHHVRHEPLHVPAALPVASRRRRRRLRRRRRGRQHERHLGVHRLLALRARRLGLHGGRGAVPRAGVQLKPGQRRSPGAAALRLQQQELAGVRVEHLGLEQVGAVLVGEEVGGVDVLDALVQPPDAALHRPRRDELHDGADRQRQEAEDEVDELLAGLREQHLLRLAVHQQLQA
ncbi:Os05g0115650, partial [Oryza sativa Japonica Group]